MGLRDAWESEAANWVAWARTPEHDSYWTFHRDAFPELLPAPRGVTLDIGCGEGRLPRDLKTHGHEVMGIDASPTLIEHAAAVVTMGGYNSVCELLASGRPGLVVPRVAHHAAPRQISRPPSVTIKDGIDR